jgi:hypothetical protein
VPVGQTYFAHAPAPRRRRSSRARELTPRQRAIAQSLVSSYERGPQVGALGKALGHAANSYLGIKRKAHRADPTGLLGTEFDVGEELVRGTLDFPSVLGRGLYATARHPVRQAGRVLHGSPEYQRAQRQLLQLRAQGRTKEANALMAELTRATSSSPFVGGPGQMAMFPMRRLPTGSLFLHGTTAEYLKPFNRPEETVPGLTWSDPLSIFQRRKKLLQETGSTTGEGFTTSDVARARGRRQSAQQLDAPFLLNRSRIGIYGAGHYVSQLPSRLVSEEGVSARAHSYARFDTGHDVPGANVRPYMLRPAPKESDLRSDVRLFDTDKAITAQDLAKARREMAKRGLGERFERVLATKQARHPSVYTYDVPKAFEQLNLARSGFSFLGSDPVEAMTRYANRNGPLMRGDQFLRVIEETLQGRATVSAAALRGAKAWDKEDIRAIQAEERNAPLREQAHPAWWDYSTDPYLRLREAAGSSSFSQIQAPARQTARIQGVRGAGGNQIPAVAAEQSNMLSRMGYEGVWIPHGGGENVHEIVAFHPGVFRAYKDVPRPSARLRSIAQDAPWLRAAHKHAKKGTPIEIPLDEVSLYMHQGGLGIGPKSDPSHPHIRTTGRPIRHPDQVEREIHGIEGTLPEGIAPLGAQAFLRHLSRGMRPARPELSQLRAAHPSVASVAADALFEGPGKVEPGQAYYHPDGHWGIERAAAGDPGPKYRLIAPDGTKYRLMKHEFDNAWREIMLAAQEPGFRGRTMAQADQAIAKFRGQQGIRSGKKRPPTQAELEQGLREQGPTGIDERGAVVRGVRVPRSGVEFDTLFRQDRDGVPLEAYKQPPELGKYLDPGMLRAIAEPLLNHPNIPAGEAFHEFSLFLDKLQGDLTNLWYKRRHLATQRDIEVRPGEKSTTSDFEQWRQTLPVHERWQDISRLAARYERIRGEPGPEAIRHIRYTDAGGLKKLLKVKQKDWLQALKKLGEQGATDVELVQPGMEVRTGPRTRFGITFSKGVEQAMRKRRPPRGKRRRYGSEDGGSSKP